MTLRPAFSATTTPAIAFSTNRVNIVDKKGTIVGDLVADGGGCIAVLRNHKEHFTVAMDSRFGDIRLVSGSAPDEKASIDLHFVKKGSVTVPEIVMVDSSGRAYIMGETGKVSPYKPGGHSLSMMERLIPHSVLSHLKNE